MKIDKQTLINSAFKSENFKKIGYGMTSGECFENKWFYMKHVGKYLSVEILLTRECR
jgi:hypothetical protein